MRETPEDRHPGGFSLPMRTSRRRTYVPGLSKVKRVVAKSETRLSCRSPAAKTRKSPQRVLGAFPR